MESKAAKIWSYVIHSKDPDTDRYNDKHVVSLLDEIESAQMAVESDSFGYVYYTTAVIVMDEDVDSVDQKARIVRQVFMDCGFKASIEMLMR